MSQQFFDYVLGGDSVRPRNKPFPDIYNLAISKLGTSKNIIVEDSPPGIQSGKSSNNYVVAIDRGIFSKKELSNADIIVQELTPDLFIEINKSLQFLTIMLINYKTDLGVKCD